MDACKPKVNCRSYVIPRNFGFWLFLICCLLRYRAGRTLASCVYVVKMEHSDFWADSSIFLDMLQVVTASSPLCSLDVPLSKSVSCIHTASSSAKRLTCGAPTADARSSMQKRKRSSNRTDPCGMPCFKVTVRLLTPSNVTKVSWLDSHAWIHCTM